MPFQLFNCLDLVLHLDLEDALVYSCIDCLELHKRHIRQASLLSRQGHDGVTLNWKQFMKINNNKTRCKYSFKRKIQ
jgi:hypothetical protein